MIDSTSLTSKAMMLCASLSAAACAATVMSCWLWSVTVTVFFRLGGLGRPRRAAGVAFQDLTPPQRPRNAFPGSRGRRGRTGRRPVTGSPGGRPSGYWVFGGW
ncbi:hypothetical protein GCM10010502_58470 [Kitasatospora aureofaciens]|uniref:Secreted protein n=1 Tax=Kitasatospora aureofaciens TaxID=1894 RepID=A0A8H9I1N4_KITAU|nr:hypothetical protein GCM10010502_58470 [Kitasatospora aureofaciens]